ncbi:helicase domino [Anopheles bellator]|uniref:helicase domino n=1 Tax=Anopheles bellator TaxID=139047 RepID=UPI002649D52A|nr:helicase domino [Anopheles bellator]
MNEADTAGGQRGCNQVLPAGTDAKVLKVLNTGQLSTGSRAGVSPMSRSLHENKQNLEHQQQQQQALTGLRQQEQQKLQQMQPVGTPSSSSLSGNSNSVTSNVNIATNVFSVQQEPTQGSGNRASLTASCSDAKNATVVGIASDGRTESLQSVCGSGNSNSDAACSGEITDDGEVLAAVDTRADLSELPAGSTFHASGDGGCGSVANLYIKTDTISLPSVGVTAGVLGTVEAAVAVAGSGSSGESASATDRIGVSVPQTSVVSPNASRKRIKLEAGADVEHDISALKKLILEQKYMRLRSIKERYSEHVAELFFLQTGGSMMEYPVWRKKPATPAFTNFIRTYKLEPLSSNLEEAGEALKQQSTRAISSPVGSGVSVSSSISLSSGHGNNSSSTLSGSLPQGAEIKISGVGVTPVAVSTTLPAAVAQLSQQGGTPIIPDPIGIGAIGTTGTTLERKKYALSSTAGGATIIEQETVGSASPRNLHASNGSLIGNTRSGTVGVSSTIGNDRSNSGTSCARVQGLLLNSVQRQNGTMGYGNGGSSVGSGSSGGNSNGSDQYTNKAKQEVYVMQRVQELQKEGLWTERRLPKVQEPPRPKAHWDYLLEEMVWLAADFAQERKWKKAAAKKCARMVQKHFQDKALAAQRAEKAQELQLKRIAAFVAKEIKMFWSNVEKLVEYKQQTKLDEKRKKALDQQLSFIVDQTEKYSQQLVEGMNKTVLPSAITAPPTAASSKAESLNSSRISSPLPGRTAAVIGSDDEFCPEAESSDDDEETIAKAEAEAEEGTKDEVAALQKESEMDLDDFLRDLPKGYLENRDKIVLSERKDSSEAEEVQHGDKRGVGSREAEDDADKDFSADEDSTDDEDTIREQEKKEKNEDHKREIDELNADNEMSIDELIAKYKNRPPPEQVMDVDSDDDEDPDEQGNEVNDRTRRRQSRKRTPSDSTFTEEEDEEEEDDEEVGSGSEEGLTGSDDDEEVEEEETDMEDDQVAIKEDQQDVIGLKNLLDDGTSSAKTQSEKDDMLNDAAAIAESIQPKGNTLSSTSVVTPIPFLLKHSLREYQHIGLDWLVTMHDRKLNGILADEMGLGKTIQTISLLAHLACVKGNWGPHLIIVPSSVMLNWEMEFKKWCPGFKILTYYGTPKERKLKRTGWTKVNAFHVCITSYKLVIQDHQSFRRKKWKYLILDEAQNIKNFKSQRWQLLLNFQTEQRLLLTGTPLQNNLMELWSLMHFLMPHVFQSHREFKEWFSNPMTGMIEGNSEYNDTIIKRLHKVLRPFLLRRLKSEVEKQMPKKYEHVVMCRLSKRQRFLYDDFMSRAKTRETLASGNLLSVINVLMQLRKVCNHPNMFEERPTISPFRMEGISFKTASLVYNMLNYDPFTQIDLSSVNLVLIQLELLLSAYVAHRSQRLCMPRRLIEEIDSTPMPPPRCPTGKLRLHVRIPHQWVQESISGGPRSTGVRVGTSPAMKTDGTIFVPLVNASSALDKKSSLLASGFDEARWRRSSTVLGTALVADSSTGNNNSRSVSPSVILRKRCDIGTSSVLPTNAVSQQHHSKLSSGQVLHFIPQAATIASTSSTSSYVITGRVPVGTAGVSNRQFGTVQRTFTPAAAGLVQRLVTNQQSTPTPATASRLVQNVGQQTQISSTLAATIMQQLKHHSYSSKSSPASSNSGGVMSAADSSVGDESEEHRRARDRTEFYLARIEISRKERRSQILELLGGINTKRCDAVPIYGEDLRESLCALFAEEFHTRSELIPFGVAGAYYIRKAMALRTSVNATQPNDPSASQWTLSATIKTIEQRAQGLRSTISNFVIFVPAVCAPAPCLLVSHPHPSRLNGEKQWEAAISEKIQPAMELLHPIISAMSTQFPDPRLIQYDCGKLQTLDRLLKKLKSENHRVLIFTQMTRMLDVLEAFLNFHGHIYLRLDGTTKVEQRQVLMERFNNDKRMFAFILSTRSGGVGINLTGADTVIFYDSDWNPTMDAQAQDRCHRIGQTRDVHIYRLVSEKTIEENILKKANQKRILGDLAIEGGNFTTAYFKSSTTVQDLFAVDTAEDDASTRLAEVLDRDRERKERLNATSVTAAAGSSSATAVGTPEAMDNSKSAINVFECALAAAEDDQDVQAAKFAKAEASADLDEFDENIPIDEEKMVVGGEGVKEPELSKAEKEVQNLIKQLSPIERYAMRFVEDTEGTWTAVQLKAMEQEFEQKKRDWEANQLAEQRRNEEAARQREAEEHADLLTFSREDAKNQIWISDSTMEKMPMWCPPTPPQDDNDLYVDYSLSFLYDTTNLIPETELPTVYVKKADKRSRSEAGFYPDGRRPAKVRREDTYYAPRSLFDRPTAQIAKIRKEYKLQRYKGIINPFPPMPAQKPSTVPMKTKTESEGVPEWMVYEDMAILNVVQNLQGLPLNLMLISPGHTANWDLVSDIVNQTSRTYRLPKQCRNRYENVILPREEGKLIESPKKPKKNKNPLKQPSSGSSPPHPSSPPKQIRSMRTALLYTSDANTSFIKLMRQKFDNIRAAYGKRTLQVKHPLSSGMPTSSMKNIKHAQVLAKHGVSDYDTPLTPGEIAKNRAERFSKEKLKQTAAQEQGAQQQQGQQPATVQGTTQKIHIVAVAPQTPTTASVVATSNIQQPQLTTAAGVQTLAVAQQQQQPPQQQQQLQLQQGPSGQQIPSVMSPMQPQHLLQQQLQLQAHPIAQQQQQQQATIVVCGVPTNATSTVATIVQASPLQAARVTSATGNQPQVVNICSSNGQQQIVKAIVASPATQNLLSQQLAQAAQQQQSNNNGSQQQQTQPSQQQHQVSVVLTTPVSTLSATNSVQLQSQPQIVSIHQPVSAQQQLLPTSSTVTQASSTSLVQTLSSQSIPQVVSVAQLASVGSAMTTGSSAATIQPSQVTTLTTSALRAQRIVAPPGTLQEVVLHQRTGSQSPTVVSVSSLGGGLTPAQLQTTQLRLSMAGAQQMSGVVGKSIVGTVTSAGKPVNTSQIQFYRQQPVRQQLKVLHPGTATTPSGAGTTTTVLQSAGQPTLVSPAIIQGNIIQTGTVGGQTVQVQQATVGTGAVTTGQKVAVTGGAAVTQVVSTTGVSGTVTQPTTVANVSSAAGNTIATVQVQGQSRMQYIKQMATKHMITRPVTENEMQLMVKRQIIGQQHKQQLIPQTQTIFAPANLQMQQAGTSGQQIATLVKTSSGTVGTTGMTLSQVKAGQLKTIGNQNQVRQLHLQQQILAQQRKAGGKLTQITQVAGKAGQPTQLFVQGPKNLPAGTVTVQQIQQVIRHAQPGTLASGGQIVLGKAGVSRMIPVSVSQQANQRQTIQVVTATSAAQAIAAGNIRAHVPGQNIGTIKVATGGATSAQQQQVILNAIQSQQAQRSNASPVRLQTTSSGSLVAVTVQQPPQQPQIIGASLPSSNTPNSSANSATSSGGNNVVATTAVEIVSSQGSQSQGGVLAGGQHVVSSAPQVLALQQQTAQIITTTSAMVQAGSGASGVLATTDSGNMVAGSGPAASTVVSQAVQSSVSGSASSASASAAVAVAGGAGGSTALSTMASQQPQATQPTPQQQSQVSMIKKKQSPNVAK